MHDELPERAAEKAVALIRRGDADVLMKGLIGTDILLRAILNKVSGLLPEGRVLTHISVAEIPSYPKLLFFTDVAVIPYPTQKQRIEQVRYTASVCHQLGILEPHIALIHCAEHGGRQFPFVDGYQDIKRMAEAGAFGRCIVDGPLDVKSACSLEALKAKGISSPLDGESDVLVMPDIEAGNAFFAHDFRAEAQAVCAGNFPVRDIPEDHLPIEFVVGIRVQRKAGSLPHGAESHFPEAEKLLHEGRRLRRAEKINLIISTRKQHTVFYPRNVLTDEFCGHRRHDGLFETHKSGLRF